MIRNSAFKLNTNKYDQWFDINSAAYHSEIKAFQKLGISGKAIEIGIGTGKFAVPLGIRTGVEPTSQMYQKAAAQGLDIIAGTAENLPILSDTYDWAVMITTICFVNDPQKSAREMHRILKEGGRCAVGFVDKDTPLGAKYLAKKDKSDFYKEAVFYSASDVEDIIVKAGFTEITAWQTLFDPSMSETEEPQEGFGRGGFAVISGKKA
jgi:ubiquinone/menaquinone biosynthesis C-methylase UbiE